MKDEINIPEFALESSIIVLIKDPKFV